jgi:hypothetical protein
MATWVSVRAIGSRPSSRRGPGVTPTLYSELGRFRNSLLQNMREEAPVNKNPQAPNRGALRKSLRASPWMTNGKVWRTEFSALDYIRYVINDTRPHEIQARAGGVLAFNWSGTGGVSTKFFPISHLSEGGIAGRLGRRGGPSIFAAPAGHAELIGGKVFLRFVHHPGTKANNFVERAVDRTWRDTSPVMSAALKRAIEDDLLEMTMTTRSFATGA